MRFTNHIIRRFLTDESFHWEILELYYPDVAQAARQGKLETIESERGAGWLGAEELLSTDGNQNFYITNSVLQQLDMLKVVKQRPESGPDRFNWTVFKQISNRKVTFIFPENEFLRVMFRDEKIIFFNLKMVPDRSKSNFGQANWTMYYVDRITGEEADHAQSSQAKAIEHRIYALLCFMYLTKNTEVILQPGAKMGTIKTGKIINELPFPLTVVNSKWNITSIRHEGFDVRGHFAIRWTGKGRSTAELVFIEPFRKHGLVRKAGNKENHP